MEWELELVRRRERRRDLIIEGLEEKDRNDKAEIKNWIEEAVVVEVVIERVKNKAGGKVLVKCANCKEKEKVMLLKESLRARRYI